jgi:hypothetical protein
VALLALEASAFWAARACIFMMEGSDDIDKRIAQIKLRRLEDINKSLSLAIERERISVTNASFL